MLKNAVFFLIFILLSISSPAEQTGDSISVSPSSGKRPSGMKVRMPEKDFFNIYLADKSYKYEEGYGEEFKNNFFSRLWHRIIQVWKVGLKTFHYLPLALKYGFYILSILLLIVIITQTRLSKVFYTEGEISGVDFSEDKMLERKTDFNETVSIQISRQNYRNAIRYLHLKILREMEINGIVRFSREKTNREYAREISDSKLQQTFYQLSGIYNMVWFGNQNLSKEEFDILASGFYKFSVLISDQKE